MAFTKTPSQDTYQTKMVTLLKEQNDRSINATKDIDYLNVYFELVKNKELQDQDAFICKRSGSQQYIASVGAGFVRGMWYNDNFQRLYYCVGDTMYIWNVNTNTLSTTIPAFFGTTTGDVGFCDYLYDTGGVAIIATDGTTLKQIDSANTVTACTDPDLPAHLPYPVFLDGYLFLVKQSTGDIYNSDLNNPLGWTPGNFISAEIQADNSLRIAKLNNYLVVFGTGSIEYFWDAGNASGSPLQRNDTPVKFNGYLGGLASYGQKLYFVGNNVQNQPSVFVLEDFKIDEVATPTVQRYLGDITTANQYLTRKGSIFGIDGHTFYLINYGPQTYVYDLDTKLWSRWAFGNGTNFSMTFAINCKNNSENHPLFTNDTGTAIYEFQPTLYQDIGTTFTCQGVTDNQHFETYNQKTMSRLVVWADRPTSNGTLSIQWSDDDYQNFTTARTINLNQERPDLNRLGRFRKRAFKWTWIQNLPLRLKAFEVDLNMGQT